ncbi:nuclear transport factor 2 family protein [Paraburkholderia sp. J63]|uniref:nuclear transport factor 2 family protein n=1 Tax=Paraburkholderia sp. J63 TaxID=2805434 RepID=UPI002ABDE73A|nr:nuclear transport factor 2 family protein [Paraburkholderia sp. J63]
MNDEAVMRDIARLENVRCRALVERDFDVLRELVADDLVHVHANGKLDGRDAYLHAVEEEIDFLSVERKDLNVRVYADVAIATGHLQQTVQLRATARRIPMSIMTTQVWRRGPDGWRQVSFQATNV